jgi:hypothetical protein
MARLALYIAHQFAEPSQNIKTQNVDYRHMMINGGIYRYSIDNG